MVCVWSLYELLQLISYLISKRRFLLAYLDWYQCRGMYECGILPFLIIKFVGKYARKKNTNSKYPKIENKSRSWIDMNLSILQIWYSKHPQVCELKHMWVVHTSCTVFHTCRPWPRRWHLMYELQYILKMLCKPQLGEMLSEVAFFLGVWSFLMYKY